MKRATRAAGDGAIVFVGGLYWAVYPDAQTHPGADSTCREGKLHAAAFHR